MQPVGGQALIVLHKVLLHFYRSFDEGEVARLAHEAGAIIVKIHVLEAFQETLVFIVFLLLDRDFRRWQVAGRRIR